MGKNKKIQRNTFDLLIIGAGAAGMTAAIFAARNNQSVCIIEKLDKVGKKILATGNGKCNFTNANLDASCYGADCDFISQILEQFSLDDCLDFFHSLGIYPKNKNGYYYPNSEQASSVVTAFSQEIQRLGITVVYDAQVTEIFPSNERVEVETNKGLYSGKHLIIATGLLAAPKLGSDGSLFTIIKDLGHRFQPILPALCGFYCKGFPFKQASGVRAHGTVTAVIDQQVLASDTGEIQFTDYGLSGIPVFQISRYLSKGIYQKQTVEIHINLLPDFDKNQLENELNYRKRLWKEEPAEQLLNGLLNQKLANLILDKAQINPDLLLTSLSDREIEAIIHAIFNLKVKVTNYRDFEFAQVCTGGIPICDINPDTLESKFAKRIHFAGEILDVDGICGGYNLHFAWATGKIAAMATLERAV